MRIARCRKVIGLPIAADEMASIFERLGLAAVREGEGANEVFVVTPPSYRFDIELEEDLIEEVARVYGFERIPAHPPVSRAAMHAQPENRRSLHTLRERLAASDYTEVVNFSFVEPAWESDFAGNDDPIKLLNPIASPLSVMRSTLVGGLIGNIRYNLNRKAGRVRVFEVGRVFLRSPDTPDGPLTVAGLHQPMRVAAAAFGPAAEQQWGQPTRAVDFFDVKADLEALIEPLHARFEPAEHPALHPRRAARVLIDGHPAGWIGELHPKWQQKYELPGPVVLVELDAAPLQTVPLPEYEEVSRFPPVIRDRSVELPDAIPVQAVLDELAARKPAVVRDLRVFDLYRGKGVEPGRKSLAFRVVMQDTARTLTDAEADQVMDELTRALEARFGAKLRT
jgi:phenylalanyl-tRNA synthetase beta chain